MHRAPRPSAPAPIGLSPPGDGIPWLRLVMGMVLLAVSFAVSQQSGHRPGRAPPAAEPHTVLPRFAVGEPLAPLEAVGPLARRASPSPTAASRTSASECPVAAKSATTPERRSAKPLRIAAHRIHPRARGRAPRPGLAFRHGASPWSTGYDQVAAARLTRRRADVRREYIAARDVVAALTGEDSGSAYLARAAARARAHPPAHNRRQLLRAAT